MVTLIWLPIAYNLPSSGNIIDFSDIGGVISGGGILLIVNDLFVDYKDPVLWFVRSLILLYISFYVFAYFLSIKKVQIAFVLLWILTVATCVISYFSNGAFGLNSMSGIPLFTVGVIAAFYQDKYYKIFNWSFIPLIISFVLLSVVFSYHPRALANIFHSLADYATIGVILLVFSRFRPVVKFPAVLGAITFDIYLVHFKALVIISNSDIDLSFLLFVVSTAFASIGFYLLRTRIFKI